MHWAAAEGDESYWHTAEEVYSTGSLVCIPKILGLAREETDAVGAAWT